MPRIFLSYRRSDTSSDAGRLFQDLKKSYGAKNVFKDVNSITPGEQWLARINREIASCKIILVLIGPNWLTVDHEGVLLLNSPEDYVRQEIELALKGNATIIPVCVRGANMPVPSDLPDCIRNLTKYNAAQLRLDPDYSKDLDLLLSSIGSPGIFTPFRLKCFFGIIIISISLLIYIFNGRIISNLRKEVGVLPPMSLQTREILIRGARSISYKDHNGTWVFGDIDGDGNEEYIQFLATEKDGKYFNIIFSDTAQSLQFLGIGFDSMGDPIDGTIYEIGIKDADSNGSDEIYFAAQRADKAMLWVINYNHERRVPEPAGSFEGRGFKLLPEGRLVIQQIREQDDLISIWKNGRYEAAKPMHPPD